MSCCGKGNPSLVATVAKGVAGLTRAMVDPVEDEEMQARRARCAVCHERNPPPKDFAKVPGLRQLSELGQCNICKCWIKPKTRAKKGTCPLDLWPR